MKRSMARPVACSHSVCGWKDIQPDDVVTLLIPYYLCRSSVLLKCSAIVQNGWPSLNRDSHWLVVPDLYNNLTWMEWLETGWDLATICLRAEILNGWEHILDSGKKVHKNTLWHVASKTMFLCTFSHCSVVLQYRIHGRLPHLWRL